MLNFQRVHFLMRENCNMEIFSTRYETDGKCTNENVRECQIDRICVIKTVFCI